MAYLVDDGTGVPAACGAPLKVGALGAAARHSTGLELTVDSVPAGDWDRAAAAFDDLSYDQTAAYTEARWGAKRISHALVRSGDRVVGGARLVILALPGWGRGIAYVKYGPFWRRRGEAPDPSRYRAVVEALAHEYCSRRGHALTVIPRPSPTHSAVEQAILAELGFVARRPATDADRYIVDLSLAREEQLRSLDQRWRYNLRRGLAHELSFEMSDDLGAFETFAALHREMVARKHAAHSDPLHLLADLSAGLPAGLRPRTALGWHGGRPVVGAVIASLGDTAYYLFGASADAAQPLKAGYALQWFLLEQLAGTGARWYDLGGNVGDAGLRQFKKGLVGRGGAVVKVREYERSTGMSRLAAGTVHFARDAARTGRALAARIGALDV